jgi:glycosyltransferase involved in cell wall biosynthesis
MRMALAHPGVGPFVQQTARALLEAELLTNYWTTFADRPQAHWRHLAVWLARAHGLNLDLELARRSVTEVPIDLLRLNPFWEIVRILLSKLNCDRRILDAVFEYETVAFDRHVARNALNNADGLYGYEFSSLASFHEAQRRGLARVYEVPSPEHDFVEALIQNEIERFPELDDGKRLYFLKRQAQRTKRRRQEWALADVVIANSAFTRNSYAEAGLDVAKVRVIPLGAPPVENEIAESGGTEAKPLRVLYAGTFSVRKGGHYLLKAWRELAVGNNATLEIYGAVTLPRKLMNNLPGSITVSHSVPRGELFRCYGTADVLVFPTLCDGFGMVVTEAFSRGLPVITTTRAGASDLVKHGENGLIVPAGDVQALVEALEWCLTHRTKLRAMRRAALETAARWQWKDFRRALVPKIVDGLREAGYVL